MRNSWFTAPLALLTLLPLACSEGDTNSAVEESPAVAVRTAIVDQAPFALRESFTGTLKGDRQTVLVAKLSSTVTGVSVSVGEQITRGQRVIDLDPGGVQSQYRQTEALCRDAETQLGKIESLFAAGAVSQRELELGRTGFDVARANFEAARQAVEIESPIAGVVTDLYVRTGDEVAPGEPLVEVADVGALRLTLDVPSSQIGRLSVGQPVKVCAPYDTAVCMAGSIRSIADAADRDTRTFEVECRFSEPLPSLAPGTFVSAEVTLRTLPSALSVPDEAVIYRGGQAFAYAVDADTTLLVPLEVLARDRGRTAVDGALKPGQRVVITGQKNLTPGTRIREATS